MKALIISIEAMMFVACAAAADEPPCNLEGLPSAVHQFLRRDAICTMAEDVSKITGQRKDQVLAQ